MKTADEITHACGLRIFRVGTDGGCGEIRYGKLIGSIIWSFGGGWEHVSVCPYKRSYTPSWAEMCRIKDIFWRDDETVVQYHPAKSEYVNNMPNCLHLWRPISQVMPIPPAIMVGIKDGQTMSEVKAAVAALEEVDEEHDI